MEYMDGIIDSLKSTARSVAAASNPDLDIDNRATAGWALTELHEAVLVIAAYSVVVLAGLAMYTPPARKDGSRKTKGKKSSAPATWSQVAERFAASPVLTSVKLAYNVVQVVLCLWMVVFTLQNASAAGYLKHYAETGTLCLTKDQWPSADLSERSAAERNLTFVLWVFYVSKVLDFADTVFIVLQGNWAQFSFLHVFHHFSIFAFYWLNIHAGYDGDIWYTIVANGTIHAIMYYYYILTTLGARPWWKSLLTYAQMLQFVTMMTQAAYGFAAPQCAQPRPIGVAYFFYILFLFVLFAHFAARSYCPSRKAKEE